MAVAVTMVMLCFGILVEVYMANARFYRVSAPSSFLFGPVGRYGLSRWHSLRTVPTISLMESYYDWNLWVVY